jgi:hypothetical protein
MPPLAIPTNAFAAVTLNAAKHHTLGEGNRGPAVGLEEVASAGIVYSKLNRFLRHHSYEIDFEASVQTFEPITSNYLPRAIDRAGVQALGLADLLDKSRLNHVDGKNTEIQE